MSTLQSPNCREKPASQHEELKTQRSKRLWEALEAALRSPMPDNIFYYIRSYYVHYVILSIQYTYIYIYYLTYIYIYTWLASPKEPGHPNKT